MGSSWRHTSDPSGNDFGGRVDDHSVSWNASKFSKVLIASREEVSSSESDGIS
jgi:hypothetical protein